MNQFCKERDPHWLLGCQKETSIEKQKGGSLCSPAWPSLTSVHSPCSPHYVVFGSEKKIFILKAVFPNPDVTHISADAL